MNLHTFESMLSIGETVAVELIQKERMYTENANKALREGFITPDNLEPDPKNPIIASFFRNIGRADRLGSGVRNLFKYSKYYSGQDPEFREGDVFRIIVPLDEEYSFDYGLDHEAGEMIGGGSAVKIDGKNDGKTNGKTTDKAGTKAETTDKADIKEETTDKIAGKTTDKVDVKGKTTGKTGVITETTYFLCRQALKKDSLPVGRNRISLFSNYIKN